MVNYLTAQASGNWIAIVIIVIILIPAIRTTVKHMKGEGDCCGGPKEKVPKKKMDGPKLRELTVHIEGSIARIAKIVLRSMSMSWTV